MLSEKNKILIVEDEQDIRDLLIFNLQKEGFKVDSVDNSDSALSLIRKSNFDLITFNQNMLIVKLLIIRLREIYFEKKYIY